MKRVMIVGANSGIAKEVAAVLASSGVALRLLARDCEEVDRVAQDLRLRFESAIETHAFQADPGTDYAALFEGEDLDAVIICYGVLVERDDAIQDAASHRRMIEVNYTSTALLLAAAARYFEPRGHGTIAALSSVAGDRGRASNYPYAATKAGVSALLSGMRAHLSRKGVRVITVKPGPTATPMTDGAQGVRGPLADPARVAKDIVKAMRRGKDVVYTPGKWRPIMAVVRAIPEWVFKRLKF